MDRIAANLAKETILPPQRPESIASTISDNVGIFADTSGESYGKMITKSFCIRHLKIIYNLSYLNSIIIYSEIYSF